MIDDPRIDPDDLRKARFPGSFRRYDAKAVEEFLESVAERVEATNVLVDELRAQLEQARSIKRVEPPTESASPFDAPDLSALPEEELVRLVGAETAHVLSTARQASSDIRSKAEEAAARMIREATAEATRLTEEAEAAAAELRTEAEAVRDSAVEEAEAEAASLREAVAAEAEEILALAREQAETETAAAAALREEAEQEAARILDAARDEGRSMVNEAKEVRTRVLEDLQRRRDLGRSQVERLVAGREQILSAYAAVRANVDEITAQLEDGLLESGADPVLEEGFVGVVVTSGETVDIDAALEELVADDDDNDSDGTEASEAAGGESEPESEPTVDEAGKDADPDPAVGETAVDDSDETTTGPDDAGPEETAESGEDGDVDALFARIRSERAESVARAQKVLSEDPSDADADADGDADTAEPDDADPGAEEATEPAEAKTADAETVDAADAPADPDAEVDPALLAAADALQHRASVIDDIDKKLSRALKRHLADEQNAVLDALRQSQSTDPSTLLPGADDHVQGYAAVAEAHLTSAAEAGAATVGADASVDVSALALQLGSTLIDPFRRRIERSAAEVEGDADALDERLRALYREWKVEHIAAATTDALLSAFATGQHDAAPDDATLQWRIDPSQGPCPDAQDNALAGAITKGESFPTGDRCPQAHPGCRGLLVVDA